VAASLSMTAFGRDVQRKDGRMTRDGPAALARRIAATDLSGRFDGTREPRVDPGSGAELLGSGQGRHRRDLPHACHPGNPTETTPAPDGPETGVWIRLDPAGYRRHKCDGLFGGG